jgi:filamentous hemagglutinin family protein
MATSRAQSNFRPKLLSLAVASCFATSAALANPTGGVTIRGTPATITNPAANVLNIQTYSPQTIINWRSFSISAGELTRFMQPSATSAVLNRVAAGASPSSILGTLESNGRVFLINPNGILFGAGAKVDVGGLVASSLNLSNSDFLAKRMHFTGGQGAGAVINQGNIETRKGGKVYLIGGEVINSGIITSPRGEVILAAGSSVELVNPGTPSLRVEVVAADHEAKNLGAIAADAGRIGIYAGLINNSGTIRADSAVSEGGRILLKATKSVTLEDSSVLSAQGQGGGEIKVLAGDNVQVAGRLDASAPTAGHGGFIETSAKNVAVDSGAIITTAAPHGNTGTWLIDPADFTIGANGDISGAVLSTQLGLNNVVITSDAGLLVPIGSGDIFVGDQITWTAATSLTLLARRNVELGSSSISGGGDLVIKAGWNGDPQSPLITSGVGDITSSFGTIETRGSVFFDAGRDIVLGASTVAAGAVALGSGAAPDGLSKTVQLIAGRSISLTAPDGGTSVLATGNNGSNGTIILDAKTGTISTQAANILATGGGLPTANGGSAEVTLNAAGGITLNNSTVSAAGGGAITGGSGMATLNAGGGITISGSTVTASGGGGSRGAGGNATVSLRTGGDITLASSVAANGGAGSTGSPAGTARIFLTFLSSTGDFFVNGVPGAIVGTLGRVSEGFFVDGKPAILNVNFFVTHGAPAFTDILVATMNQQADVLADQLKAGEIGWADDKEKKLALCS